MMKYYRFKKIADQAENIIAVQEGVIKKLCTEEELPCRQVLKLQPIYCTARFC